MPQPDADAMDRTFAALADPTRRAILARLAAEAAGGSAAESGGSSAGNSGGDSGGGGEGVRVTDLAAPFVGASPGEGAMSLPAVSKHLRVLERAGLLKQEKDGRVRRCHLVAGPLQDAHDWVAFYRRFWTDRLDALADYLESENDNTQRKH